jgi:hypothetical protein
MKFQCSAVAAATVLIACSGAGEGGFGVDDGGTSSADGATTNGSSGASSSGTTGSSSGGSASSSDSSSSGSSSGGGDAGRGDSGIADAAGRDAPGTDSGTGADSAATVHYATQIGPLLDRNCTSACHGGCGGLNISYANIVNVASGQVPSLSYIAPNDPGRSYLFCKVAPQDAACTGAGTMIRNSRMPPGGPYLSAANLSLIKTWIQQGAPQ